MTEETTKLTAPVFNDEIVKFRKVIDQCSKRKFGFLLRRGKQWAAMANPQKQRRAKDLIAMAMILKKVDKDEVAKFALQNTKTTRELFELKDATIEHRALFHMMSDKPFVAAVDSFRERYPQWYIDVPYLLQRFGLKSTEKKKKPKKSKGASLKGLFDLKEAKEKDGDESDEDDITKLGGVVEGEEVNESASEAETTDAEASESEAESEPEVKEPPKPVKHVKAKPEIKEKRRAFEKKQDRKPVRQNLPREAKPKRKPNENLAKGPSGKRTKLNEAPTKEAKEENAEHLHPSWEAKRKLKEQMASGPAGKKITFGDED